MSQSQEDEKEQMLADAILIIHSVAFLEKKINETLAELEEAVNNHFYEDAERIEAQIRFLLKKANDENANMSQFMQKHEDRINEKKTILSSSK